MVTPRPTARLSPMGNPLHSARARGGHWTCSRARHENLQVGRPGPRQRHRCARPRAGSRHRHRRLATGLRGRSHPGRRRCAHRRRVDPHVRARCGGRRRSGAGVAAPAVAGTAPGSGRAAVGATTPDAGARHAALLRRLHVPPEDATLPDPLRLRSHAPLRGDPDGLLNVRGPVEAPHHKQRSRSFSISSISSTVTVRAGMKRTVSGRGALTSSPRSTKRLASPRRSAGASSSPRPRTSPWPSPAASARSRSVR